MAVALSLLLGSGLRAAVTRCRVASRGLTGSGPVGREPDPDSDWEPEERELQEVESILKRQKKAVRVQRIRRQMEPPGPPPRTLTREAMDQIRYLHKEFADYWSVPKLAEGFDVSTDVIQRVLKSKFVPTLEQKLKQDRKVLKKTGLVHSLQQLQGPGDTSQSLTVGHSVSGSLLMPRKEASWRSQSRGTTLKVREPNIESANAPWCQEGRKKDIRGLGKESSVPVPVAVDHQREPKIPPGGCEDTRVTGSIGWPGDKKLEEPKADKPDDQNFSSRVVQRGREFFDSNGNFLYRI
ncbi:neugrin [Ctenodactylus gundi]